MSPFPPKKNGGPGGWSAPTRWRTPFPGLNKSRVGEAAPMIPAKIELLSLKLTKTPLKIGHPNRKQSYSNHPFSGAKLLLVSGRVGFLPDSSAQKKAWSLIPDISWYTVGTFGGWSPIFSIQKMEVGTESQWTKMDQVSCYIELLDTQVCFSGGSVKIVGPVWDVLEWYGPCQELFLFEKGADCFFL